MNTGTTNEASTGGRPRKKPTTKVKVVASRYALSLQKSNQEAKRIQEQLDSDHRSEKLAASAPVDARKRVAASAPATSVTPKCDRSANSVGRSEAAPRVRSLPSPASFSAATPSSARVRSTTPTAGSKRHLAETTSGSAEAGGEVKDGSVMASSTPQDMKARLEAYRASKQHRTQPGVAHVHSKRASTAAASTRLPTKHLRQSPSCSDTAFSIKMASSTRPAFPKRIASASTGIAERAAKQSTPSASPVAPKHTKLSPRYTKSTAAVASTVKALPTAHHSDSEELELLQSLYFQMCFVEAKGTATFHRQEESAQQQMIGAWEIIQSKLQLLHDTTLRLDKERHTANLETHLIEQAAPIIAVASHLPPLLDALTRICSSLSSALHRMPTQGVACRPDELKKHMDELTDILEDVLGQLASTGLGESLSSAVEFERTMCEASNKLNASLMKLAHLLDEVHIEIDAETSVAIQRIQQLRIGSNDADKPH